MNKPLPQSRFSKAYWDNYDRVFRRACPVCGGPADHIEVKTPEGPMEVYGCAKCCPNPNDELVVSL